MVPRSRRGKHRRSHSAPLSSAVGGRADGPRAGRTGSAAQLSRQPDQDRSRRRCAMNSGCRVMDSDLHVMETGDVYERYLDVAYRDQMPRYMGLAATNFPWWSVQGRPIPPWATAEDVVGPQNFLDAPT